MKESLRQELYWQLKASCTHPAVVWYQWSIDPWYKERSLEWLFKDDGLQTAYPLLKALKLQGFIDEQLQKFPGRVIRAVGQVQPACYSPWRRFI